MHAKRIAIHDASILIDLISANLLDGCLQLPYCFCTTDIILAELHDWQQAKLQVYIEGGSFTLISMSEEEWSQVTTMAETNTRLSAEDLSAFCHAKRHDALLLTGDQLLRKLAIKNHLNVAGILFVFDEMVAAGLVVPVNAAELLRELCMRNKRLPKRECEARITGWSGGREAVA